MGDLRFQRSYQRVRDADDPVTVLNRLSDEDVIAALAAASQQGDPYLANILATEAMNRTRRATAVARTLGEGVVAVDSRGRITFVNPAAEVMLDRGRGQMLGQDLHDTLQARPSVAASPGEPDEAADAGASASSILNVLDTGKVSHGEAELTRRRGGAFPAEFTAAPVVREGEVEGAVVVFHDIAERKRSDRALDESEQRYRSLFHHNPDAIFSFDVEGRFLSANPACEAISGHAPEELIGRPFAPLLTEESLEPALETFAKVLSGEPQTEEYTLIHRDGHPVDVRVTGVPMVVDGDVVGMYGVARDITAGRRAAAALTRRMETERALSEVSARLVDPRDMDDAIHAVLAELGRLAGADRAYLFRIRRRGDAEARIDNTHEWCAEGVAPQIQILQDLPAADFAWWMGRLRRGEAIHVPDVSDMPPEAATEQKLLEVQDITSLIVLPMETGDRLDGFIGFDNVGDAPATPWRDEDVRALRVASQILGSALARHRTEERLRTLNRELEQRVAERTKALETTNRELESFAYTVSHDLKEPLRGVEALSRFLLEDLHERVDAESQDHLERIDRAVGRMKTTLEAALHLSRASRGDLRREPVDLTALAKDVLSDLATRAPERDVDVTVDEGLVAEADPRLARTVLENLLGNAWKYTAREPRPRIHVGAAPATTPAPGPAPDVPAFFVRDNGAGFDPKEAHRLFQPFQRLHSNSEFVGSGVGLATVRRAVERHGGRAWAESDGPGAGATFHFTLGAASK